ncbi:hypothetical protein [Nocardia noduli]|uniref:hypothetical protein n=1 Tax=Nocardia noduli TaxID=2815722 RepID=UPI001C212495|nr:hypothetical protein [Nocardia noduli]
MCSAHTSTGTATITDPIERLSTLIERVHTDTPRARSAINLVPSENRMSPTAHAMLGTDYSNRYFFNEALTGVWEFRGGEAVAELEIAGRQAFSRLACAEYVNLRPLSGLNAMMIALSGLGGLPGHTVVSISPASGGHYATGAVITRLGYRWASVDCTRGSVDLAALEQILTDRAVSLVYLDVQNSRHRLEVGAVAELLVRYPGVRLHVDISHTLGLVLGGAHANPLDHGAGSVGGSLHKSFPGPHHGMLFTRDGAIAEMLREAQYVLVSSHHFGHTLASAVTALEFEHYGRGYAHAVLDNARILAAALTEYGFDVPGAGSGFTDTHQVWVRLDDAAGVSDVLAEWGIRVNIQSDLPDCPGPMWRLGTAEPTVLGADGAEMGELARILADARDGHTRRGRDAAQGLRDRIGIRPWWSRTGTEAGAAS